MSLGFAATQITYLKKKDDINKKLANDGDGKKRHITENNKYQIGATSSVISFAKSCIEWQRTEDEEPAAAEKNSHRKKVRCFRAKKRSNARDAHSSTKEEICGKNRRKMEGSCYKSCDGSACGLHQHKTNNNHHTKRAANNKKQTNYHQRIRCCQIRYGLRTLNYRLGSVLFGLTRLGSCFFSLVPPL